MEDLHSQPKQPTEQQLLPVNLLPASSLPTAFQGLLPGRTEEAKARGWPEALQGDVYLPGLAGTQPTNLHIPEQTHRHAGRRAGPQRSAEQGRGPVWLPVQAVVGSDKGHLSGASLRELGSLILFPHPSKSNLTRLRGTWASDSSNRNREGASPYCC